jgi:hypothetical protein
MEQSPFWKTDSSSSGQKRSLKVHMSPPLGHILSQLNPFHTLFSVYPISIAILSIHLHPRPPSVNLRLYSATKISYAFPHYPQACYMSLPSNSLWFNYTNNIFLKGPNYKVSHHIFFPILLLSLSQVQILSSVLCSHIPDFSSLRAKDQISHPSETTGKIMTTICGLFQNKIRFL